MKNLTVIPSSDLTVYLGKLEVQIQALQKILDMHMSVKEVMPLFDHDNKYKNATITKMTEIGDYHNAIYLELEKRMKNEMGLDVEYDKFTDIDTEVRKAFVRAQEVRKQQEAEAAKKK